MGLHHRRVIDLIMQTEVIRVAYTELDEKVTGICSITVAWNEHTVPINLDGTVTLTVLGIHKTYTLAEIAKLIEKHQKL